MTVVRKDYFDSGAQFREDYHHKFNAAPFVAKTTRYLWLVSSELFRYEASELTTSTGEAAQHLPPTTLQLYMK